MNQTWHDQWTHKWTLRG